MTYIVHEIFHTLQGEGVNSGTPAVFVRFAGCNLWSGREADRTSAICQFCDTQFRGGEKHTITSLVAAVTSHRTELVVFTGGEPALQLDQGLVDALRAQGRRVAIETNGTLDFPDVDWVCISPKAGAERVWQRANELKLVFPQPGLSPEDAESFVDAETYWLSPMDGPNLQANTALAVAYIKANPGWRLNIQAHKFWGIA
jgi:7-carboxy-7-deazaguanine synthase (Cx14CxxC type)